MTMLGERPPVPAASSGRTTEVEEKTFKPVKLWAVIGVAFLALEIWALTGWIVSGNATPTPVGSSEVPLYMKVFIRTWEVVAFPALGVFLWHFMIKPWRREGRITTDGLFCLVFATIWWQDPMSNYIVPYFTYNAYLVNYGTWISNIPGWILPNAHKIAEAPIWTFPIYVYLVFGLAVTGNVVMRKAKARWPQLSKAGLFGVCFAFFFVVDIILEPILMFMGFWSYPGIVKELSLFYGNYYQFPLYEALLWGGVWACWSSLRYFRNDKGETVAERGIEELKVGPRAKTGVRFLALAGICNFAFLFVYNIPQQFFALNADPWPEDIAKRSYFTNGLCGEGTEYACAGPHTPMARRDSARVSPDGKLILPEGVKFEVVPHVD